MRNIVSEMMRLSNKLYRAMERRQLEVYYQPQVDCQTGEISGMEALLRWNHPELGMVSPAKFIPLAEQTGLVIPIGEWILRTACGQAKQWQEEGLDRVKLGVNLSLKQFQNHAWSVSVALRDKQEAHRARNLFAASGVHAGRS